MKLNFESILQYSFKIVKDNLFVIILYPFSSAVIIAALYLLGISSSLFFISQLTKGISGILLFWALITLLFGLLTYILEHYLMNIYILLLESGRVNQAVPVGQIFKYSLQKTGPVIISLLVYGSLVVVGFIFFIIPGIILLLQYSQVYYLTLIDGLSIKEAFSESKRMTKGNELRLLFLFIVIGGISYLLGHLLNVIRMPSILISLVQLYAGNYLIIVSYSTFYYLKNNCG
ncbi:hypothetical protein A2334_05600 [Candidatus Roizmanbacteria bacterium RIFOXYB2_FULL_38_10]|uniref:Glycerophosphoryl diester phosphodiesterase membrane domain-containing protein n=1 Tax=Candidatus Roizmanbacteria bacterium RIFOXYD1_FULL_38_12 TaxID=1802093 RepID=A0A1F7L0V0_9BACT|nr:MAG: hypothetical protein A3K47_02720 [Candidatus Roizmanbacteria bacterium RIFOXYA2_FULL_38_14]OGK63681.1 MAG: hypothetical protein A3K27_02720 [Candidatus Roizmanbacteria bacterium RIFOXYA1_FULL_37_12]OGK65527.1 MAG: hypothetical protein A3K38_02720 [Candidatus Roizmanbacteria bacterium RIFOXYB1_FULL_40_23]OGK68311.1 MAG: hypothetical protein A2334_05600 [Candidatus Roizmanbacteria bacterium RIFOXYB2_FULL_38_10]OGK69932.1 MAG: hypothetical protein A3K21_02725 [Candidatus Roizmanbacteria ba